MYEKGWTTFQAFTVDFDDNDDDDYDDAGIKFFNFIIFQPFFFL